MIPALLAFAALAALAGALWIDYRHTAAAAENCRRQVMHHLLHRGDRP